MVITSGGDQVRFDGLDFTVSRRAEFERLALLDAIDDAQATARAIVRAHGVRDRADRQDHPRDRIRSLRSRREDLKGTMRWSAESASAPHACVRRLRGGHVPGIDDLRATTQALVGYRGKSGPARCITAKD